MSQLAAVSAGHPLGASCWFCGRLSAADALMAGSGAMVSLSAGELFGEDHRAWGPDDHVDECHDGPTRSAVGPADR